jgi:hypothetical protein
MKGSSGVVEGVVRSAEGRKPCSPFQAVLLPSNLRVSLVRRNSATQRREFRGVPSANLAATKFFPPIARPRFPVGNKLLLNFLAKLLLRGNVVLIHSPHTDFLLGNRT